MRIFRNLDVTSTRERNKFYLCCFLSLIVACLNLVQLQVFNYYLIENALSVMNLTIVLVTFIIFNALLLLNNFFIFSTLNWITSSISNRLAKRVFLQNPKVYRSNKILNSNLISTAVLETSYYRLNYLRPLADLLIGFGTISSTIIFLVLNKEVFILSIILFISISCAVFLKYSKPFTQRQGFMRSKGNSFRTSILSNLDNYHNEYYQKEYIYQHINKYMRYTNIVAKAQAAQGIVNFSLKPFVETLFIASIAFIFFVTKDSSSSVSLSLGTLLVSGYKILPEFSKISQSLNKLKYSQSSYDKINEQFNMRIDNSIASTSFEPRTKYFIENGSISLELNVSDPKLFLINGPSGCGKTTFLENCIYNNSDTNLLRFVDGKKLQNQFYLSPKCYYYNTQNARILKSDRFKLLRSTRRHDLISYLQEFSLYRILEQLINSPKEFIDTKFSGGEEQRLQLISILMSDNRDFIFLDEPTSGLDNDNRRNVWLILKKLATKSNVVIVSHDSCGFDFCDESISLR